MWGEVREDVLAEAQRRRVFLDRMNNLMSILNFLIGFFAALRLCENSFAA